MPSARTVFHAFLILTFLALALSIFGFWEGRIGVLLAVVSAGIVGMLGAIGTHYFDNNRPARRAA